MKLPARVLSAFIAFTFLFTSIIPPQSGYAQTIFNLPAPGTMVALSPVFCPAVIKGLTIDPENPLHLDFIVDTGDSKISGEELSQESRRLIKYFLASLTVPEKELWVNLSPYEEGRIISDEFGKTEMGRDLLAQDYILKQLSASLMYPEKDLGKEFWNRVYTKARELYGTTQIPLNTFNKIWIIPDRAAIYEHGTSAIIVDSHLKVMLEGDYLTVQNNLNNKNLGTDRMAQDDVNKINDVSGQIVREVLIPEIEKEVNQGKNFANLRQIYNSMILATWYKQALKEGLLGQVYANKNKTKGIELEDKGENEKIYQQYLEAFKKGVYNYIKEDVDAETGKLMPRKYFSGGYSMEKLPQIVRSQVIKGELNSSPVGVQKLVQSGLQTSGPVNRVKVVLVENTGEQQLAQISGQPSSSPINLFSPSLKGEVESILRSEIEPIIKPSHVIYSARANAARIVLAHLDWPEFRKLETSAKSTIEYRLDAPANPFGGNEDHYKSQVIAADAVLSHPEMFPTKLSRAESVLKSEIDPIITPSFVIYSAKANAARIVLAHLDRPELKKLESSAKFAIEHRLDAPANPFGGNEDHYKSQVIAADAVLSHPEMFPTKLSRAESVLKSEIDPIIKPSHVIYSAKANAARIVLAHRDRPEFRKLESSAKSAIEYRLDAPANPFGGNEDHYESRVIASEAVLKSGDTGPKSSPVQERAQQPATSNQPPLRLSSGQVATSQKLDQPRSFPIPFPGTTLWDINQLNSKDPGKRMDAIKRLGRKKDPSAFEPLRRIVGDDKEYEIVRALAAWALAPLEDKRALEPLMNVVRNTNEKVVVRILAVDTIISLGGEEAKLLIETMVRLQEEISRISGKKYLTDQYYIYTHLPQALEWREQGYDFVLNFQQEQGKYNLETNEWHVDVPEKFEIVQGEKLKGPATSNQPPLRLSSGQVATDQNLKKPSSPIGLGQQPREAPGKTSRQGQKISSLLRDLSGRELENGKQELTPDGRIINRFLLKGPGSFTVIITAGSNAPGTVEIKQVATISIGEELILLTLPLPPKADIVKYKEILATLAEQQEEAERQSFLADYVAELQANLKNLRTLTELPSLIMIPGEIQAFGGFKIVEHILNPGELSGVSRTLSLRYVEHDMRTEVSLTDSGISTSGWLTGDWTVIKDPNAILGALEKALIDEIDKSQARMQARKPPSSPVDATERFRRGGDVVGLHNLAIDQTQEGLAKARSAGLLAEMKGPAEIALARGAHPDALLAQTVEPGGLVAAARAGADVLIASKMLDKDEIRQAREAASAQGRKIVIIAGVNPTSTEPQPEAQIAQAVANGVDGVKLKPAGGLQESRTLELIQIIKEKYPGLVIMVAGGVNKANRQKFGKDVIAGMGADKMDDIGTISQWAKTNTVTELSPSSPVGVDLTQTEKLQEESRERFASADQKINETLFPAKGQPDITVMRKQIGMSASEQGQSIFINLPLGKHENLVPIYAQTEDIVTEVLGEDRAKQMDLKQIHLTIATPEVGVDKMQLSLEEILAEAKEDASGKGVFEVRLLGPHLMPNGAVVMEYEVLAPEFVDMRLKAGQRIAQRKLLNQNRSSVPQIYHSTVAFLTDDVTSLEEFREIQQRINAMREEIQAGPPVKVTIRKVAVSIIDSSSRRIIRNVEFEFGNQTIFIEAGRSSPIVNDEHQARSENPGGIDLNPALLDLQIRRDENGVPLPLPQQPIQNMRIDGFLPVIINITPIPSLPALLGMKDEKEMELSSTK